MRTLVVSDLHLGAMERVDLARRPELRAPLLERIREADRLVVLGDAVELREVPVQHAAAEALGFFSDVGEALGPGGELVLVGGNHDHNLLAGWTEMHLLQDLPRSMSLEHRITPEEAGPIPRRIAEAAAPATVGWAYPGLWLRDDVYALHGHYLDLHTTVPTIERLAAGAMARYLVPIPEQGATPDDYEAVLAPLYAWMFALAQRSKAGVARAGARSSARAYVAMAGAGRSQKPIRARLMGAGLLGAVKAINRAGIGPVEPELSNAALRRGSLLGISEVVRRLGIDAGHVLFGHSHRSGPWPSDDASEWTTREGVHLLNTGSWVYQPHFLTPRPGESPYWPGTVITVDDDGPPRLERLLGDVPHERLRPAPR